MPQCKGCGLPLLRARVWCSEGCRSRWRSLNDPDYMESKRRSARRHQRRLRAEGRRPTEERACEDCGVVRAVRKDKRTRFCPDCARRWVARNRTAGGVSHKYERINAALRAEIYERDGWVCQLCGGPVDRGAPPNDLWGPTLDHIVPKSWLLVPDHRAENLRLAHRWCNAVRGDESHYDESVFEVS